MHLIIFRTVSRGMHICSDENICRWHLLLRGQYVYVCFANLWMRVWNSAKNFESAFQVINIVVYSLLTTWIQRCGKFSPKKRNVWFIDVSRKWWYRIDNRILRRCQRNLLFTDSLGFQTARAANLTLIPLFRKREKRPTTVVLQNPTWLCLIKRTNVNLSLYRLNFNEKSYMKRVLRIKIPLQHATTHCSVQIENGVIFLFFFSGLL